MLLILFLNRFGRPDPHVGLAHSAAPCHFCGATHLSVLLSTEKETKKISTAAILIAVPEEKAIRFNKRFSLLLQLVTAPPTVGRTKRRRGERQSVCCTFTQLPVRHACTTSLATENGPYYLHKCNYSLFFLNRCAAPSLQPKTTLAKNLVSQKQKAANFRVYARAVQLADA